MVNDEAPAWTPGSLLLDEFAVERELGRGGYGQVLLVRSRRSGQRYAAKRTTIQQADERQRFVAEAHRWIGLPPHPNVVACRFVRTIGDTMIVFSEHVPGGSLADWIASGRLYAADEPARTALRIAAETALGLHAAHAAGMLHLDLKPSNVLLTDDGTAKIADFGLAERKSEDPQVALQMEAVIDYVAGPDVSAPEHAIIAGVLRQALASGPESLEAVPGNRTLGYASPEQIERRTVGRYSDLWSWAVTVMEAFRGERTWRTGALAGDVLERYLRQPADTWRLEVTPALADLLRSCLRPDPADRPASLEAVADAVYAIAGLPPATAPASSRKVLHQRKLPSGGDWRDPRYRLWEAYELAGLDPSGFTAYLPTQSGNRQSQSLEDLRALDEAGRVLEGSALDKAVRLRATILAETARIKESVGDRGGALARWRESTALLETRADPESRLLLAHVLTGMGIALRKDEPAANRTLDRALEIAGTLLPDPNALGIKGSALLAKGNTAMLFHRADAPKLFDAALRAAEECGDDIGTAKALAAKAGALARNGAHTEADEHWHRAEQLLASVGTVGRQDLEGTRAAIALNRSSTERSIVAKLRYAEQSLELLKPLVEEQGWHEFTHLLGEALLQTGRLKTSIGEPAEALEAFRTARELLTKAVLDDGQIEHTELLADAFERESALALRVEGPQAGAAATRHAVDLWRRLVEADGAERWLDQFISAKSTLAAALVAAGDHAAAEREFEELWALLEE